MAANNNKQKDEHLELSESALDQVAGGLRDGWTPGQPAYETYEDIIFA